MNDTTEKTELTPAEKWAVVEGYFGADITPGDLIFAWEDRVRLVNEKNALHNKIALSILAVPAESDRA